MNVNGGEETGGYISILFLFVRQYELILLLTVCLTFVKCLLFFVVFFSVALKARDIFMGLH